MLTLKYPTDRTIRCVIPSEIGRLPSAAEVSAGRTPGIFDVEAGTDEVIIDAHAEREILAQRESLERAGLVVEVSE